MLKGDTKVDKRKGEVRNLLFIFSSTGQLINTIDVKKLFEDAMPDATHRSREKTWVAFYFTDEEDLFLISEEGYIYFIDPKTGQFPDNKQP